MREKTIALSLILVLACSMFLSAGIRSVSASGANQIYWGAWVGDHHIGYPDLLTGFETQVSKGVSIWNWIQLWNQPQDSENMPNFDTSLMDQCRQHGAIPLVSWAPAASAGDGFTSLQDILDGKWDSYLTAWGQASAAWGHPYFLRLMWEFTGNWNIYNPTQGSGYGYYPWGNGNSPEKFVAAWQYVVDKVRAAGGTQITWVWCPADVGDSVSTLRSVYPGDQYVDWVGTDVYPTDGKSFAQAAQPELDNIRSVAPDKPVMFPEIGDSSTDPAYWSDVLTNVIPKDFPYVKAVVIWEDPLKGFTVVDSKTLPSFQQAIASNYYSSNIYASIDTSPIPPIATIINDSSVSTPTLSSSASLFSLTSGFALIVILSLTITLAVSASIVLMYRKRRAAKDTS